MRLVYISGGFQTSLCSSSRTPKYLDVNLIKQIREIQSKSIEISKHRSRMQNDRAKLLTP
ncbi:hypothetical protein H4I95_02413 [Botrytis cinerea]